MPTTNFMREVGMNDDLAATLARMNDELGWSFKRIAKWIEVNL
jgi:hypothetical protein